VLIDHCGCLATAFDCRDIHTVAPSDAEQAVRTSTAGRWPLHAHETKGGEQMDRICRRCRLARAQAEIFRQRPQDLVRQGEPLDSVALLQVSARDLPRNPTVTGIDDASGDGRGDDGKARSHDRRVGFRMRLADNTINVTSAAC
jgi:hypothetical protein